MQAANAKEKVRKQVLICNDDFMLANLLDQKLRKHLQTQNKIVEDGNSALEALDKSHFDLVLTAFQLPFKSGYDIVQHVRTGQKSGTSVIIMAYGLTDDVIMNASLMGADDFIQAPYNAVELLIRTRKLLM